MDARKKRISLKILFSIISLGVFLCAVPLVMMSPMLFDAPGSEKIPLNWILLVAISSVPLSMLYALVLGNWKGLRHFAIGFGELALVVLLFLSVRLFK